MKSPKNQSEEKLMLSRSGVTLENDELEVLALPEMGGKILQIVDKTSGNYFLKEPAVNLCNVDLPQKNQSFLPPYAAGFDECFPTVSPCKYNENGKSIQLPDHGELWTQSWDFRQTEDGITLWTTGEQFNYRFTKEIQLTGSNIKLNYVLKNLNAEGFDYLWSAHPLLAVEQGDELLLPEEVTELMMNWSSDSALGMVGDRLSWPHLGKGNRTIDYRIVQPVTTDFAIKLFTDRLTTGTAGLYRKAIDQSLIFSFDAAQIPFLGVWLCYGGWPESKTAGEYTVALEPCCGRPDSLQEARKWGSHKHIAGGTLQNWELEISIFDGKYKGLLQ